VHQLIAPPVRHPAGRIPVVVDTVIAKQGVQRGQQQAGG
jgi:hypothetical protein